MIKSLLHSFLFGILSALTALFLQLVLFTALSFGYKLTEHFPFFVLGAFSLIEEVTRFFSIRQTLQPRPDTVSYAFIQGTLFGIGFATVEASITLWTYPHISPIAILPVIGIHIVLSVFLTGILTYFRNTYIFFVAFLLIFGIHFAYNAFVQHFFLST